MFEPRPLSMSSQAASLTEEGAGPLVVAIASGKGGVGKTFVSTNTAVAARRLGKRVLIIDGDLALANVDVALGTATQHTIEDVLGGQVSLEDAIVHGPADVDILPGGNGVFALTNLGDAQRNSLLSQLAPLRARYDLVIVDCAAGVGDNVVFFSGAADMRLIVVTPDPTSIVDAYGALKVMAMHGGVREAHIVMNRASNVDARAVFQKLSDVAGRFLPIRLMYAGAIPADGAVQRSVMRQEPAVVSSPSAPASRAVVDLALRLFGPQARAVNAVNAVNPTAGAPAAMNIATAEVK